MAKAQDQIEINTDVQIKETTSYVIPINDLGECKRIEHLLNFEGIEFKKWNIKQIEDYESKEQEEYPIVAIKDELYKEVKEVSEIFEVDPYNLVNLLVQSFLENIISDDLAALFCYFKAILESSENLDFSKKLSKIIDKISQKYKFPGYLIQNLKTDLKHFIKTGINLEHIAVLVPKALLKHKRKEYASLGYGSDSEIVASALRSL